MNSKTGKDFKVGEVYAYENSVGREEMFIFSDCVHSSGEVIGKKALIKNQSRGLTTYSTANLMDYSSYCWDKPFKLFDDVDKGFEYMLGLTPFTEIQYGTVSDLRFVNQTVLCCVVKPYCTLINDLRGKTHVLFQSQIKCDGQKLPFGSTWSEAVKKYQDYNQLTLDTI